MTDSAASATTLHPKNPPLGSIAESPSTPRKTRDTVQNKVIRRRFQLLRTAANLLPGERIAGCQKHIAPGHDQVELARSTDQKSALFKHVLVCESYSCPVCAYWRAEADRHELSIALAQAQKLGLSPVLVTCTLSHHWGDKLADLQDTVNQAFDKSFSGRWYQDLKEEWGIQGKISNWETTIGANGWHPHKHVLFLCSYALTASQVSHLADLIKERWVQIVSDLGYTASYEHGIDVTTADSKIADYIAKFGREPMDKAWGVEHEIALSPAKSAGLEGMTPFDLLAAAAGDQAQMVRLSAFMNCRDFDKVRAMAGWLYKQYYSVFKGVPRIHWGKTRKLLELDQALESYAAENPPEKTEREAVATISRKVWKRICDPDDDMRSELLIFARTATGDQLLKWFETRGLVADVLIYEPAASSKICEKSTPVQKSMFERSQTQWH